MTRLFIILLLLCFTVSCAAVNAVKSGEAKSAASEKLDAADDYISDASITTSVKMKLASDLKLKSRKISVTTAAGVVTMVGTVESEEERLLAIKLAELTEGVTEVKSQVQVRKPR